MPDDVAQQNDPLAEQFLSQASVAERINVRIGALPDWPQAQCVACLQLLHRLVQGASATIYFHWDHGNDARDLFRATVNLIRAGDGPSRTHSAIRVALTAAVVVHSDCLLEACNSIHQRLRREDIRTHRVTDLVKEARRLHESLTPPDHCGDVSPGCLRVREIFNDAPVGDDIVVPPDWCVTSEGISVVGGDAVGILIHVPVVVCRTLTNVNGEERMEIAWRRDGQWVRHAANQSVFATVQNIVALADRGLPVTSNNARDLVQYLDEFVAVNSGQLPRGISSNRLGWIAAGNIRGFLCGSEFVSAQSEPSLENEVECRSPQPTVVFQGADSGDAELVSAIRRSGSLDGWRGAIQCLAPFPRTHLALYASLAPSLLEPAQAANFFLSYAGATTQGKTTCLKIAASCWGVPAIGNTGYGAPGFVRSWDSTRTALERTCAVQDCLPTIIDDTKTANDSKDVPHLIYDFCSGRGRGRGSKNGLASTSAWRTVVISSGESQLTSFSQEGGTRARVLEVWGSPFGGTSRELAALIIRLGEGISENHGHAGLEFVRALARWRFDGFNFNARFRELREVFVAMAGSNNVAARMAEHFALLRMTADFAHHIGLIPWHYHDAIENLWPELTAETPEADLALTALRYVVSWCQGHQQEFRGAPSSGNSVPASGWAGRWEVAGREPGTPHCLGILSHRLEHILQSGGFESHAIKRMWKDRGWLRSNQPRTDLRVRIDDRDARSAAAVIAIRWDLILQELGEIGGEGGGQTHSG